MHFVLLVLKSVVEVFLEEMVEGDAAVDVVVTDEIYWFLMYTMQVLRSFRMYYKSLVGCKINIINTCRFIQYSTPRENSITLSLYIISWHVYNFY